MQHATVLHFNGASSAIAALQALGELADTLLDEFEDATVVMEGTDSFVLMTEDQVEERLLEGLAIYDFDVLSTSPLHTDAEPSARNLSA